MSEIHEMGLEMDQRREEWSEAENTSQIPANTLAKLSRAKDDIEDKDDKISVILGQNHGLNKNVKKLTEKIDQLKEDHALQLALLHNEVNLMEGSTEALEVSIAEENWEKLPKTPGI